MTIANADCDKIAIENPRGIMSTLYRKPDFEYNPYDFIGETECKTTCWRVKNINPLKPTRKVPCPKNNEHAAFGGRSSMINNILGMTLKPQN